MKINPNKGKELLSTNWRMDERKKKAKGKREGGEDDNNDGSEKTMDIIWTSTMM